ncbi:hypothetical protein Tco_1066865 [Tanacetum coccineum]|uniref:Transposase (putative) gypsy type domain-containing protein n=1 Tax=Tanacetum coccineum TaxID=301880 RepID=A0ABQ5HDF9_9ASTR
MVKDGKIKIDKFTGHEFGFWKMQIEDYLYQKKLHEPLAEVKRTGMKAKDWTLLDRQALGVVRLSLAKNVAYNVVNEKTTYGLFKALSNMYEKPSVSNKVDMDVIKFDVEVQALLFTLFVHDSWDDSLEGHRSVLELFVRGIEGVLCDGSLECQVWDNACQHNENTTLTEAGCPATITMAPPAKGVGLRVADSHTGNHSEDDFTPLETIRRSYSVIREKITFELEGETFEPERGAKDSITTQTCELSQGEFNDFLALYPRISCYSSQIQLDRFYDPPGYVGLYTHSFSLANLRLPLTEFFCEVLEYFQVHISRLNPFGSAKLTTFVVMCKAYGCEPSVDLF